MVSSDVEDKLVVLEGRILDSIREGRRNDCGPVRNNETVTKIDNEDQRV